MLTPRLKALGLTAEVMRVFAALDRADFALARVAKAMRKHCVAWTETDDLLVRVPKRVFRAEPGAPVVGDWVAIATKASDDAQGRVMAVLPRHSTLSRRAAGRAFAAQVVVANVDSAFVMVGLDGDFNLRRIERYLALARQGGVVPVVLLNKSDLRDESGEALRQVAEISSGAAVHRLSAKTGEGVLALQGYLLPCHTIVILGSSGAGKSTLVNRFLGVEHMRTSQVRARDDRGRHTTTHRELIPLSSGALLIDTPGMRELGLVDHTEGIAETFAEVEALVAACRFGNCRHTNEPGCAIVAALQSGDLLPERLASYTKLTDEVGEATRRRDQDLVMAENRAVAKNRRKNR